MATDTSTSGGRFWQLDDFLLLKMLHFLDETSIGKLLQSCKLWRDLESSNRRSFWRGRIYHEFGPLRLPALPAGSPSPDMRHQPGLIDVTGDWWRNFGKLLHLGKRNYVGAAMDAVTADFEPFPMRFFMRTTDHRAEKAYIEWPTLDNSATRVNSTFQTLEESSGGLKTIRFSEVALIRGRNILIPNHYFGYICGPAVVGVYPNGAFWLLLEEATPLPGVSQQSEGSSSENLGDYDIFLQNTVLRVGHNFIGMVTMEFHPFNPFQDERHPEPIKAEMKLTLVKKLSPTDEIISQLDSEGIQHDKDDVGFFGLLWFCSRNRAGWWYSIGVKVVKVKKEKSITDKCNLIMYVVSKPSPYEQQSSQELEFFSVGSKFYAWQHRNCLIGLVKNMARQVGAFCLQDSDSNDSAGLGRAMKVISDGKVSGS